jgi:hypothetical protein
MQGLTGEVTADRDWKRHQRSEKLGYIAMARGWESKSVEDQQADAAERRAPVGPALTEEARERQARRLALGMSRARVLQDLQTACHPHHRATLEASLAFLDGELAALE